MHRWDEVPALLRGCAHDDLIDTGAIRPTLVAFAAARPLLLARLRPFAPEDAQDAVTEVLDVVSAMGADRVALAVGGTTRSLDDPTEISEAATYGDRCEVLVMLVAERGAGTVRLRSILAPLERRGDEVTVGASVTTDAVGGWSATALAACVGHDPRRAHAPDVPAMVMRCIRLGHELHAPEVPAA